MVDASVIRERFAAVGCGLPERSRRLDRRIGERDVLISEIDAWQRQRNASGARVKRKFTTQKARNKLARA
jgi:hypothetical protein